MTELALCPLCGGVPETIPWNAGYRSACRDCGLGAAIECIQEQAAEAWNSLCEDIRVGRAVRKVADGEKGFRISDPCNPHIYRDCDEAILQIYLEAIPPPLTMEGVLRDAREVISGACMTKASTMDNILDKIAAVLLKEETS